MIEDNYGFLIYELNLVIDDLISESDFDSPFIFLTLYFLVKNRHSHNSILKVSDKNRLLVSTETTMNNLLIKNIFHKKRINHIKDIVNRTFSFIEN